MKKIISLILLTCVIITSLSTNVFAQEDISVIVDGKEVIFADVKPMIMNNRTFVPVRALSESLGAKVDWDGDSQIVTITKHETRPTKIIFENTKEEKTYEQVYYNTMLQINSNILVSYKDFSQLTITSDETMDVTPVIINGRTMLPARYVANSLGYDVSWNEKTRTVTCSFTGVLQEESEEKGIVHTDTNPLDTDIVKTVLNGFYTYANFMFNPETNKKIESFLSGDNTYAEELVEFTLNIAYTDTLASLKTYYTAGGSIYKSEKDLEEECLTHFKNINIPSKYHKYFVKIDDKRGQEIDKKFFAPGYSYKMLLTNP